MERRRLYRSAHDKKILGVAGGIAEYFNTDSSLVRLIFVISIFAGTAGLWIYLILALFMKYNPDYTDPEYEQQAPKLYRARQGAVLFGVCRGLSNYYNLDCTVLRILVVLLSFFGVGLIFYICAGLIIPIEPQNS